MLSQISRMNALSDQFLDGCSAFSEHPVDYESFVEGDLFEKSDTFRACSNGVDCSDPILNHNHEDFLAELSDLEQWKSDTSSFEKDNFAGQLNSVSNAEWNEILDTMEWVDKFGPTDVSEASSGSLLEYPNNENLKKVEDVLEHADSLVDWKAWNHYLSGNADGKLEDCSDEVWDEISIHLSEDEMKNVLQNESKDIANSYACGCDPEGLDSTVDAKLGETERTIVPKSGPLTWLPSMNDVDTHDPVFSCQKSEEVSPLSSRMSKRRGIKMKPLGDEETNHRRLLNREAAFRYRERKRVEQQERRRELEALVHKNSQLKRHLRLVRMEINKWRGKVDQVRDIRL